MSSLILHRAIAIAVIVAAAAIATRITGVIFRRMEEREARTGPRGRRTTIFRLLRDVIRYVIDFLALVIALDKVGINTASILAGAGVLGLAISFGAQSVVQDLVTGAFLLYEDQFQVGERIALPALTLTGEVVELGLRTTRLRAATGELITVPNRLITEVTNFTRSVLGSGTVSVTVPVRLDADPLRVRQILEEAAGAVDRRASVTGMTEAVPGAQVWTLSATVPAQEDSAVGVRLREQALAELGRAGMLRLSWTGGGPDGA
ncbi:MAG: mechanosensitive ion channel family protein [Clostridia bacterium]